VNALVLALMVAAAGIRPFGSMQDVAIRPQEGAAASVTIDAMPFARTVTCSTYTLTGTATGSGAVTWSASPSGASGACTGTDSWSCVVDVDPDAVGEGVETITVTRGTATDTETIGFYVDGEHSCFLAQSINGTYNSGMTNADAVATWENLGSSALDVTQGVGSAQPSYRTSVVGGQPVVRCDGGDNLTASTAANWAFFTEIGDWTASHIAATSSSNPDAAQIVWTTRNIGSSSTGAAIYFDDRSGVSRNDAAITTVWNSATGAVGGSTSANGTVPSAKFGDTSFLHDDDGGAGVDFTMYADNVSVGTSSAGTYTSSSPASALRLCQNTDALFFLTGDLFRVLIYQSALTSTQRGINKAVDEWALGGTLPVTP
jgi:hypothetical protein